MDFKLYVDLQSPLKTDISIHIGPDSMQLTDFRWDESYQSESVIKAIPVRKLLEVLKVPDAEALKAYMLKHFSTEQVYDKLSDFLEKNEIRCEYEGYTSY